MSTERIKKAIQLGWDEMSDRYQADTRISLEDVHYAPLSPGERELQLIGDVKGKSVLELACGAAQNSIALSKWGACVTAMDFSPKQLQNARALVEREGVSVNLVRGDMERLSVFRDASFDIALSSFGWEFVPDLRVCFSECNRVLRNRGLLIVGTVHPLAAFEWDQDEKNLLSMPRPPQSSGTVMPVKPSSASWLHRASLRPLSVSHCSRILVGVTSFTRNSLTDSRNNN